MFTALIPTSLSAFANIDATRPFDHFLQPRREKIASPYSDVNRDTPNPIKMSDDYDPTNINAASWEEQDEDYGEADGSEQYGEAEGNDQQDIRHSSEHQEAEYSVESNPNDLGDNPSKDGNNTDDVGDDYDPASVDVVTSSVPPPTTSVRDEKTAAAPQPAAAPVVAKKPRTAGGFLVGDSDDEDEDGDDGEHKEAGSGSSSSGGSAPAPAQAPASSASATAAPQSHSPAAVQTTTTLTVQDNAGATSNAPHVPQQASLQPGATTTTAVPTVPSPAAPAAVPAPVTQAPALDKVAIYEDQIRDDPRGAMNAWLELMKEMRARSDIDGARQVYERFLAIFPQAVSEHP